MPRKKFTTSLDEDLIQRLKMKAVEEDTHASRIIELLLIDYLDKEDAKKQGRK